MEKIVVTGVGGPAGRAVASYFSESGFSVVGTDIAFVGSGLDGFFRVPRGDSPAFPSALMDILRMERPLLFVPTVTEELPQAARLKERISALGIRMFSSEPQSVDIANDKYLTACVLSDAKIPVPRTLADDEVKSAAVAGEILGYPFIAKPRQGRGGRGVVVHYTSSDAAAESRSGIVYQEFLGGEEYDVNLFQFPGGGSPVVRVLLKTSLREGIVGNALTVRAVERYDIAEIALDACAALRLEGPVDMDVRRDSKGVPNILEINARVGAHVLTAGGILEAMLKYSMEGIA
jgi:carbamoylphosphate synthase large subunit